MALCPVCNFELPSLTGALRITNRPRLRLLRYADVCVCRCNGLCYSFSVLLVNEGEDEKARQLYVFPFRGCKRCTTGAFRSCTHPINRSRTSAQHGAIPHRGFDFCGGGTEHVELFASVKRRKLSHAGIRLYCGSTSLRGRGDGPFANPGRGN